MRLAEHLDGEIINADAMQVYEDLRVLTARPTKEDEAALPHHLYGTRDGAERCSAGIWARQAAGLVHDIQTRGKLPVIVGGTGLYFRALIDGLSPIPDVPETVRQEAGAHYEKVGAAAFYAEVTGFDPAMAHLPQGDRQRLVRAWEVYQATGTPLSEFQALPREPLLAGPFRKICLMPERDQLYGNCNSRLDRMIEEGALEEVRALLARQLDPDLPVMKSLGVPELARHLSGALTLEEALAQAKTNTRRFAKRQMTWFRGQAADWEHVISAGHMTTPAFLQKQT